MYRVTKLRNRPTVATAEMPHMTSVSIGIWVGVGSRYEPEEISGVCHFIEHLLFKGTKRRSARQISEAVEGIGGSLNAFTSEEITCSSKSHDAVSAHCMSSSTTTSGRDAAAVRRKATTSSNRTYLCCAAGPAASPSSGTSRGSSFQL